jgi:hypothetical protein
MLFEDAKHSYHFRTSLLGGWKRPRLNKDDGEVGEGIFCLGTSTYPPFPLPQTQQELAEPPPALFPPDLLCRVAQASNFSHNY